MADTDKPKPQPWATPGDLGQVGKEVVPGGASRDPHTERKPAHWHSVDYETVRAIAETHHEGDTRYGYDNWRKGLPASNLIDHAMEHIFAMLEGDTSEPHLEHALWNLGKLRWMAKHKPEMIDFPKMRIYFGLPPVASTLGCGGGGGVYAAVAGDPVCRCGHGWSLHNHGGPSGRTLCTVALCGCKLFWDTTKDGLGNPRGPVGRSGGYDGRG